MSTAPSVQPAPTVIRDAVSLREIRLARCAAEHGDNFRIYRKPYNKQSPFTAGTQAHMIARLNDRDWKLVYYASFNVERPFKAGWTGYIVEVESRSQPITSMRYAFDAPAPSVLREFMKAQRAQDRLDKEKGK